MRRDLGNEVVVAVVAVALIAFAITFGIILSLANTGPAGTVLLPTATTQATSRATQPTAEVETVTSPEPDVTGASVPATAGATGQALAPTITPVPATATVIRATVARTPTIPPASDTPTARPTATPLSLDRLAMTATQLANTRHQAATDTAAQATPTERPAATHTSRPANTVAPPTATVAPSDTPQPTATRTPRPANTVAPPTATPVPSDTPAPTATRTPHPTNTPQPTSTPQPSATPTQTPTATFTASLTPTATSTPTFTPSATPTSTPTATPTRPLPTAIVLPPDAVLPTIEVFTSPNSSVTCIAPVGWVRYTILPGETLFDIARATGTTVGALRTGNCLTDANLIIAGTVIFVPRPVTGSVQTLAPVFPTAPPAGSASDSLTALGCSASGVIITAPEPGAEVTGAFELAGTATTLAFRYYEIDVRPEGVPDYDFYLRRSRPVEDSALAVINTELFGDGLHWVRLRVIDQGGNTLEPCAIPLIFR